MSVKMMTTEQIHNDLSLIHRMWSGGIPQEQADRVNALKGELKRRGVEAKAPSDMPQSVQPGVLEDMNDDQLAKELRDLSVSIGKDPGNDGLQERFANVRFEMRKRATKAKTEQLTHTPDAHPSNGNGTRIAENPGEAVAEPYGRVIGGQRSEAREAALKEEFLAAQATHISRMEEMTRKVNLAKIAADVTATIIAKHADPNGDDIENACVIGLQVATNIFDKVGL